VSRAFVTRVMNVRNFLQLQGNCRHSKDDRVSRSRGLSLSDFAISVACSGSAVDTLVL
jgi:hypothetical protein